MIKFIDMFSGIGGFREGLTRAGGFECVGHCEIDKYANRSYPTFYDKETVTVTDADGTPHEIMVYTMNAPYRDQLLPVNSRYNAVVLQGCLDAGISPQQFYDADEKYRKAYKARAAPTPKKHAPER